LGSGQLARRVRAEASWFESLAVASRPLQRRPCRNDLTDEQSPWIRRAGTIVYGCNTTMRYRLEIKEEARQQLKTLPKEQRRNVGRRLDALQLDLSGDVKKLTAKTHEYRLRVGTLRVLFTLEKDLISVYAVRDRKKAYG
jgi:mRNA interferase RelE/StbE